MSQTTLIANGTVVAADGEFDGDVLIEGEKITALGRVAAPEGADVVDATGCFVLPGAIDKPPDDSLLKRIRSALQALR